MNIHKNGRPIVDLEDWHVRATPKADYQWVEGRSAMETAKAWLEASAKGAMPAEVLAALEAHLAFGPLTAWSAEPEARLRFDGFAGEPRNSDLLVKASDASGNYIIAVEAKADEPFGETVGQAMTNATKRKAANPRSNGVARIEQLVTALLGEGRTPMDPDVSELRYQLFTATAGALAEAEREGVTRAVLLIQEFVTSKTMPDKQEANMRDLKGFIRQLAPGHPYPEGTALAGPLSVPGGKLFARAGKAPTLCIGKVVGTLDGAS